MWVLGMELVNLTSVEQIAHYSDNLASDQICIISLTPQSLTYSGISVAMEKAT